MDYNVVVKESYTQAPHYFSIIAFHIEITPLVDGMYELIQKPDGDVRTEVPNSDSEEPKPTDLIDTTTGKPRCIILLLFLNYAIYYYLLCI